MSLAAINPQNLDVRDEKTFLSLVLRNSVNAALLEILPTLELPECYLVAGCLFQTVWNCLCGKDPGADIIDYDIFYFDPTDLSWQAEDAVIRGAATAVGQLGVEVQIRNQARVHLWYARKFGIECPPLRSSRDSIDHFLHETSCFGIRPHAGAVAVYAPFGYKDLFSLKVRPNRQRNLPELYQRKAQRWSQAWPALTVVPWSEAGY